ncbi:hypothetical protein FG05_12947 [Fusarium graminearum]|nr:hypothetical protein FG05_12947 [Fusarium graminearum]
MYISAALVAIKCSLTSSQPAQVTALGFPPPDMSSAELKARRSSFPLAYGLSLGLEYLIPPLVELKIKLSCLPVYCEEDHIALGRLNKYPQGLLKPYVDNVFDSIIDRDTPDGVMYDTIKKLNELGAKWLYVKNWLNQVVLLFRYAVMVHRLCKRPWKALDLTGNSTLSRRVLGSNVDLNSHYTDGTPKDDAYMEYDLGYAAGADTVSHIQSLLIAAKPQLEPLATYMTAALLQTEEIVRAGKVMRYVFQFQAVACGLALNGETDDLAAKVGCDRKIYYDLYLIVRIETPENTYTVRCEWDEKRNQNQEAY